MDELTTSLHKTGDLFNDRRQAAIYLALIKHGVSGIEKIHQETGIHRESIQRELKKMEQRGTISITQKGRNKKIQAVSVSKLQEILESEKQKFDFILKPLLEVEAENQHPRIKVYTGNHAFGQLQLKLMKLQPAGEDIYLISAHPEAWRKAMVESGKLSQYEKLRVEKKVGTLLTCYSEYRGQVEYNNRVIFANQPQATKRKFRYIDTKDTSPVQIQIWHNHIVLGIDGAIPCIHMVFEDKNIKKAMKSYFDILWKIATP